MTERQLCSPRPKNRSTRCSQPRSAVPFPIEHAASQGRHHKSRPPRRRRKRLVWEFDPAYDRCGSKCENLAVSMCRPVYPKAWSQNLRHENVLTTFSSYGDVARE
jgi:hypothetical protein